MASKKIPEARARPEAKEKDTESTVSEKGMSLGKRISDSGYVGFAHWDLEAFDDLIADLRDQILDKIKINIRGEDFTVDEALKEIVDEGFKIASDEYEPFVYFDGEFGEPLKYDGDATAIRIELPIGPSDDESPAWYFSMAKFIDEWIEGSKEGFLTDPDLFLPEETIPWTLRLRDAFQAIVDKLDTAIREANEHHQRQR